MNKVYQVGVISDLYRAGITEDGAEYSAERFFVVVEMEDGKVFEHFMSFNGCEVKQGEEGSLFRDIRKEAKEKAEKLAARIKQALEDGKEINLQHWIEKRIYGR